MVSWIRTPRDCELWAGMQVAFPIDLATLPEVIGFAEENAYVMATGDSILAFAQMLDKPQRRQHLAKFIVDPAHRGRGHGRAFLRELLRRASADRVSLNVNEDNEVAIALYVAAGFMDAQRPPDQAAWPRTRYLEWRRQRPD